MENSWRPKIDYDVHAQIENETKVWEEKHVNKIYMDRFVRNLHDKLKNICGELAKNLMKGFTMPYDPENKILFGIIYSAVSVIGGVAITGVVCEPPVAAGVAASGVVLGVLINFGYVSDFKTVCEQAVNVRIKSLSKTKIKQKLKERYAKAMNTRVKEALETMKVEIETLKEEQKKRATENAINESSMLMFMSLDQLVFDCKQRLQNIENMFANRVLIQDAS